MRGLLAARDGRSTLVLPEGRARVTSARKPGSERYAGIVEVTSGEEPTRQAEQESYSEQKLDVVAAGSETMIPDLGG
ncbi:hypothetical protein [Streptomyces caelestis]|uniref:hypothetical protein n=1 Tax=Streptomyces caelestis TaxID=36816 RepID=UPI00366693E8